MNELEAVTLVGYSFRNSCHGHLRDVLYSAMGEAWSNLERALSKDGELT